jgi:hypothetical protein
MAETYKVLAQGVKAATAGAVTMYTVPAATQAVIKFMSFVQDGTSLDARFNVEVDGPANVPGIGQVTLSQNEWAEWEGSLALNAGQVLKLNLLSGTSGAGLSAYTISGVEIT